MTRGAWEFKYSFLLSFLILLLVLYPYLDGSGASAFVLRALFIGVLLSSVYAAGSDKRHLLIGLVLLLPGIVGHFLSVSGPARVMERNPQILSIPLYFFINWTILKHLFSERRVTGDTLCGAASGYILTGIAWIPVYIAIENLYPGTFKLTGEGAGGGEGSLNDFVYFSFTTLTTLGYGDITPQSTPAKSLAIVEAINGVLYIAVLVTKLVGMNIGNREPGA